MVTGIGSTEIIGGIFSLQYANDTLLFCNASKYNAIHLKFILYTFELSRGLKINHRKSSFFGIGIADSLTQKYAWMMGCLKDDFLTKYLGFYLHQTKAKTKDWNLSLKKEDKRLAGWNVKLLSIDGWLVLTNVVLSSIPTYWMGAN